jgi:hypothetical protein
LTARPTAVRRHQQSVSQPQMRLRGLCARFRTVRPTRTAYVRDTNDDPYESRSLVTEGCQRVPAGEARTLSSSGGCNASVASMRSAAWWDVSRPFSILIVRYVRLVPPHQFGRRPQVQPAWGRREKGCPAWTNRSYPSCGNVPRAVTKERFDQLIELAGEQGNLDELRRLADQGNTTASEVLGELEE